MTAALARPARPHRKLTLDDARYIRKQKAAGASTAFLARAFGVSRILVYNIVKGHVWPETTKKTYAKRNYGA